MATQVTSAPREKTNIAMTLQPPCPFGCDDDEYENERRIQRAVHLYTIDRSAYVDYRADSSGQHMAAYLPVAQLDYLKVSERRTGWFGRLRWQCVCVCVAMKQQGWARLVHARSRQTVRPCIAWPFMVKRGLSLKKKRNRSFFKPTERMKLWYTRPAVETARAASRSASERPT